MNFAIKHNDDYDIDERRKKEDDKKTTTTAENKDVEQQTTGKCRNAGEFPCKDIDLRRKATGEI